MPREPLSYYRKRDAEIAALFQQGWNTFQLAEEFDLGVQRIRQILRWSGCRRLRPERKSPSQVMLDLGLDKDLVSLLLKRSAD